MNPIRWNHSWKVAPVASRLQSHHAAGAPSTWRPDLVLRHGSPTAALGALGDGWVAGSSGWKCHRFSMNNGSSPCKTWGLRRISRDFLREIAIIGVVWGKICAGNHVFLNEIWISCKLFIIVYHTNPCEKMEQPSTDMKSNSQDCIASQFFEGAIIS